MDDDGLQEQVDTLSPQRRPRPAGVRRYIDTLTRHWAVVLIPLLVLPVVATAVGLKSARPVTATASLWADQGTDKQLSYANPLGTPASNTAGILTQLLQTVSFDLRIARESPLYWSTVRSRPNVDSIVVTDLSKKLQATPSGSDLIVLSFSSTHRQTGIQLLESILREAPREIKRLNQQQVANKLAFYSEQKSAAQRKLSHVTEELAGYMRHRHITSRQLAERVLFDPKLAALYQAVQTAQTNVHNIDQQLSDATSAGGTENSIQVIDPPSEVVSSISKKGLAVYLGGAFFAACLLSGTFVVLMTARDKTVRYADEVPDLLGVPILASIPFDPRLQRKEVM